MKLLIITQKVNKIDPILGFFHGWIIEFAKHFESITVICLEKGEYNLPVGNVDFNKNTEVALNDYFRLTKQKNIKFYNLDFLDFFKQIEFQEDDFVYLDPPYLITFSEYNKLWNEETERRLLDFLEWLDTQNVKFAVSNVSHYKGKVNQQFSEWSIQHNSFDIKSNYISYHDNSKKEFKEVLITNYEPEIFPPIQETIKFTELETVLR